MDSFEKDALRAQIRQAKRALTPAQIASAQRRAGGGAAAASPLPAGAVAVWLSEL